LDQPGIEAATPRHGARSSASANGFRLQDFTKERRERNGNNASMILMAPLAASSLLFVDLSNTEKREIDALTRRNARLQQLAAHRGCPPLGAEPA
jgi:hypothetical protein